jgi:hypothetical protein
MTQSTQTISPLHQRMIDDMRMHNFSPSTQRNYIRSVRDFAAYLRCSPGQASAEELRQYLLHLTDKGISATSVFRQVNQLAAVRALKSAWAGTAGCVSRRQRWPLWAVWPVRSRPARNRSPRPDRSIFEGNNLAHVVHLRSS